MAYKPKTIGELLGELEFSREDFNDLIIDLAYGDLSEVRTVYTWNGIKPADSNIVQALEKPVLVQRHEHDGLIERLKGLILPGHENGRSGFDWSKLLDHLPREVRTPQLYLSHNIPNSLRQMAERKLEPLLHQLSQDRQILIDRESNPSNGNLRQALKEYIVTPTRALISLLYSAVIPLAIQAQNKERAIDNSYIKLQRQLKMTFVDAIVIQYFEDFEDERSINYKLKVDSKLRMAQIYRDCDSKEEARSFLTKTLL